VPSEPPTERFTSAAVETPKDFNLLVSSCRGEEHEANSELEYLLRELGDKTARTGYTLVGGLTVAKTALEPTRVVDELRDSVREYPWKFRYVLKVKPVRDVVSCNIDNIVSAVVGQLSMIRSGETFRVTIEKRKNVISSKSVIDAVASRVPRKVELQNPSKVVMVEIIGDLAGVSILKPGCILGIEKEKRATSSQRSRAQSAL